MDYLKVITRLPEGRGVGEEAKSVKGREKDGVAAVE